MFDELRLFLARGKCNYIAAAAVFVAAASCSPNAGVARSEQPPHALAEGAEMVAPVSDNPNPPGKVFISESDPRSPEDQQALFNLPPGFEIQLVAAEPDIAKPMQLAFDEKGRLLVSTSTNYPLGPPPDGPPSDRVMLLEIDGETGAATSIKTFAEGFDICSGIEALPGGRALLAHAPDLLMLTDTDGDDHADRREVLYTGFARDDTHELPNSFTWGIDGWLYGLQGHVNVSDVTEKDGDVTEIHRGNVYRLQPDGTQIEVWARGMSNPWGLTFDNQLNLFAADCESRPLWQIVRGFPYQGFYQPEDPLGFAPFITEDAHGASGFAGLVSYTAEAFPPSYQHDVYLGNPINGIVHRDSLAPQGSTYRTVRRPDFLTCDDPWFRPVDVELGPDGALYIADWYNRIIAHVEVPLDHPLRDKSRGRIWRIVYRGTADELADEVRKDAIARQFAGPMASDWSEASRRELLRALGEPNAWIRRMAAAQLMARYGDNIERRCKRILTRSKNELQRVEALWLLQRLGALSWDDVVPLVEDASSTIRTQSIRIASIHATHVDAQNATEIFAHKLDDSSPLVSREAALALQRVSTLSALDALLARLDIASEGDSLLDYGLRFSARELLEEEAVMAALHDAGRTVSPSPTLLELLAATQSEEAASLLAGYLKAGTMPDELRRAAYERILDAGDKAAVETLLSQHDAIIAQSPNHLEPFARALYGNLSRVEELGADARSVLENCFPVLSASDSPSANILAYEIAGRYPFDAALPRATEAMTDPTQPDRARHLAAELVLKRKYAEMAPVARAMVSNPSESMSVRKAMAFELGKQANDDARFGALVAALETAPAQVYEGAVEGLISQRPGVDMLLAAVEDGSVSPAHIDTAIVRLRIQGIHKDDALDERYGALVAGVADQKEAARAQVASIKAAYAGDASLNVENGQQVFEANCMVCHRIQGVGGMRGPNLDGIANRGIDRMLQDILLPSFDVDPAFYTTVIRRKDGIVEEGLIIEEDADSVMLLDPTGWESDIPKANIEERTKSRVSPMPANFNQVIPEEDFLDLVHFLLNPPSKFSPLTASESEN